MGNYHNLLIILCVSIVPPVRAQIIREFNYFTAGAAYNLSCQVTGSRPAPVTNMWVGARPLSLLQTQVSLTGVAGQRIYS